MERKENEQQQEELEVSSMRSFNLEYISESDYDNESVMFTNKEHEAEDDENDDIYLNGVGFDVSDGLHVGWSCSRVCYYRWRCDSDMWIDRREKWCGRGCGSVSM